MCRVNGLGGGAVDSEFDQEKVKQVGSKKMLRKQRLYESSTALIAERGSGGNVIGSQVEKAHVDHNFTNENEGHRIDDKLHEDASKILGGVGQRV